MAQNSVNALYHGFQNPPDDARIMMRWWWFGPSVTKPELQKELETMRGAGIGGVEIQPVYPLLLDDANNGIRNLSYMSPEFLDAVDFANKTHNPWACASILPWAAAGPMAAPRPRSRYRRVGSR
jgi:hypothetical protein